jgi:hypothetical protein
MKDFRSLEQKIRAMYEGKVPDNWEENPKSKRAATAKKLTNDAMDHDKTDKIFPHVPKITEAAKDDDNDADNKPNAKKSDNDGDADNMDAKEIKGGKTEVDMHPKTDDKPEGENEDDDAPKTAKKNQKGVKEMYNPTKNFGLSDSLIEAVRKVMAPVEEELKGGQKKLDKNHNGKLDKQDFKMLRKEETVVEGNADNKEKKNAAAAAVGAKNRDNQHLGSKGMKTNVADKIRGREKMSGNDRKQFEEVVSEGPTSPVIKKEKFDTADMVAKFKAKGGTVTKGKTAAAYGAKVPKRTKAMKEDVELSVDEMARIEAIIAEIKL